MKEIKLTVSDKNFDTVLTILQNLKDGLISSIESDGKISKTKTTQYQPKVAKVIVDDNFGTANNSGKYVSPASYKQRLKAKK
jgi:hypothetical protein